MKITVNRIKDAETKKKYLDHAAREGFIDLMDKNIILDRINGGLKVVRMGARNRFKAFLKFHAYLDRYGMDGTPVKLLPHNMYFNKYVRGPTLGELHRVRSKEKWRDEKSRPKKRKLEFFLGNLKALPEHRGMRRKTCGRFFE